jgi:penicillin amidase
MHWLRLFLPLAISLLFVYTMNSRIGALPPPGKFFSPFTGFWQNNESGAVAAEEINITGLKGIVKIAIDKNLVPHIFADSNHDLYLAQGYIHAKYRLWQIEFQTHAAAGRISELIGERALPYDRQQRRFGMAFAAERAEEAMMADPMMKEALLAYTAGVNAYLAQLKTAQLPVEYKLLDYQPEPWTTLKCALLLKYMTYELAGRSSDLPLTNILKTYGQSAIDSLFSGTPYVVDPIIPAGTVWDFTPVPMPAQPAGWLSEVPVPEDQPAPHPDNGSNNWAVNGSKTASGFPILCGDPHLGLNLPSYWYQMQLVNKECNVSGVSLPGVPTIIIGFNEKIAWSETNVDADVLDWYQVKFRDNRFDEYFYDNQWKKTTKRIEVIKVRGSDAVTDTVIYTHHGPVVAQGDKALMDDDFPKGFAMRWLGHDPSVELKSFLLLNRAGDYKNFVEAMSYFSCPAQNFAYADVENNIAIWVNGKFPLKWKEQGKFLLDGSKPAHEWQGWIPHGHDPHVLNPDRAFVSSANQLSTDTTYPYYINWSMDAPRRGHRINQVLEAGTQLTAKEMIALQFDNKNMTADYLLADMIKAVNESALNPSQLQQLQSLKNWNRMAEAGGTEQTVFEAWWKKLNSAIWDDELGKEGLQYPDADITLTTVKFNRNKSWIDNKNTPATEELPALIHQSFIEAITDLETQYGADVTNWQWAAVKNTHINHLLRIPALNRNSVSTSGNQGIVNATGGGHGPSWRMIVELGKQAKAYGIYPGGQSGNPGSPFYDNMIDPWSKGLQNELLILHDANEKNAAVIATWTLKN